MVLFLPHIFLPRFLPYEFLHYLVCYEKELSTTAQSQVQIIHRFSCIMQPHQA